MRCRAYVEDTARPVRKSAAAKPMIKKVIGVRNVLKGSFHIASNKSPFPNIVSTETTARKIPDAMSTQ